MNWKGILSIFSIIFFSVKCKPIKKQTFTYPSGVTRLEASYKGGQPHGTFVAYYNDGTVEYIAHFRKGTQTGQLIEYYQNGGLKSISKFRCNRRKGRFTTYYESDEENMLSDGQYDFIENHYKTDSFSLPFISIKVGDWTFYGQNGHVDSIVNYRVEKVYYDVDTVVEATELIYIDSNLRVEYTTNRIN